MCYFLKLYDVPFETNVKTDHTIEIFRLRINLCLLKQMINLTEKR